jgi:predicted ABC-type exoprotein transport system permease subunit
LIKISGTKRKVILAGLTGLGISLILIILQTWGKPTGGSGDFPEGTVIGLVLLISTSISTFVSGALAVFLTFEDISYSREATDISFYAGCLAAILLFLFCLSTINSTAVFPACLLGTLFSVLLSVISGNTVYVILSSSKARKVKR